MMAEIVFLSLALMILLVMGYVFWGGVGRRRRDIGRGFAVTGFALAGYVATLLYDKLT